MDTFTKLFGSLLTLVYHCFDRIVSLGHLPLLTRPENIVHFFRDVHQPSVIKEVLRQASVSVVPSVGRGFDTADSVEAARESPLGAVARAPGESPRTEIREGRLLTADGVCRLAQPDRSLWSVVRCGPAASSASESLRPGKICSRLE